MGEVFRGGILVMREVAGEGREDYYYVLPG